MSRTALVRCLEVCRAHSVPLIVNDWPDLATEVGAHGAHIGQQDMPAAAARQLLGATRWLGVSTHDVAQISRAEAAGADYLGFGPCFPTTTKGYADGIAGRTAITQALAATSLPLFAIGGIGEDNLGEVLDQGCRRIAVCAAVLQAADPEAAARQLRQRLDSGLDIDQHETSAFRSKPGIKLELVKRSANDP